MENTTNDSAPPQETMTTSVTGLISIRSRHSVNDTVETAKQTLESKGIAVFALIDHSGEAKKVGIEMRPTKLLIFGNPGAGTPLMLAAPAIAIDLPLKILVWQDDQGDVWVTFNQAEYLQERYRLNPAQTKVVATAEIVARAAAR